MSHGYLRRMSISVNPDELQVVAGKYGRAAYILTTGADARVRITHAVVRVAEGSVRCKLGRGAAANVADRPGVSLLWASTDTEPMSLIADGTASVDPEGGPGFHVIAIDSAVLHRAASD